MTREGGTKRSFSPFLRFWEATRPRSPMSTLSIDIFCGGRPESESHFWREVAFSTESISQPHDMSGTSSTERLVVSPAETEQWIPGRHRDTGSGGKERVKFWLRSWWSGEKDGRRVDWKTLEAFAMEAKKWEERRVAMDEAMHHTWRLTWFGGKKLKRRIKLWITVWFWETFGLFWFRFGF